ncbi:peptidylprolyl isomerase [Serpentinicella sp. ANB-PHB4]|uniref:peptidylprolyl isomerase n=1 Tax=Serpentinicella sp. ANB-PHB4 TaxID=3074076 RepID=UPI00285E0A1B|nr:peptidylprolyl isomerase [Serpentinicella sp. ANB-PHB4]MDR5659185.1 peptidylprolyl isomerase [Serpentinicella sp. ANB-PHB4]
MNKAINKKVVLAMAGIMILVTVLSACASLYPTDKEADLPSDAVAVVNEEVVSLEEFNKLLALQKLNYENQLGPEALSQEIEGVTLLDRIKESVLEQMIFKEVVTQNALESGVEVTDTQVDAEYESFLYSIAEDENFQTALEEYGWDETFTKEFFRRELLTERYATSYMDELEISDEEVREFYDENIDYFTVDQVEARHILVEEKELAEALIERINNGEDFEELAKEYSIEPNANESGGYLGEFGRGQMVPEFELAVFSMDSGETSSEPVKTDFGYHVILVENRINEVSEFEEEVAFIKNELKQEAFQHHIIDLMENAEITTRSNL